MWMTSQPRRTLDMIAGPPEPDISAAPDSIALNICEDAPMKTGSRSMPYFSAMRASLATNHGRQLMPIGENGKGTFLRFCANNWPGNNEINVKMTIWTIVEHRNTTPEP